VSVGERARASFLPSLSLSVALLSASPTGPSTTRPT
jgi:hypothetical protein